MTDEKMIEEMAVVCGDCENSCDECFSEYEKVIWKHKIKIEDRAKHCQAILHAQRLYNAGYRKLPENAVVLTKTGIAERWIDLLIEFDEMGFEPTTLPPNDMSVEEYTAFYKARLLEFLAQARKETARDFVKDLLQELDLVGYDKSDFCVTAVKVVAEQYGVEVEE